MPDLASVDWGLVGVLVGLGVPATSAAISTWLRSRRNSRKLDALLAAFGVDPDDPPEYDVDMNLVTDGGGEHSE